MLRVVQPCGSVFSPVCRVRGLAESGDWFLWLVAECGWARPRVGSLGDKIAGSPEIRLRMKGPFCRTQELRGERSIHNNIFHLETVAKKNLFLWSCILHLKKKYLMTYLGVSRAGAQIFMLGILHTSYPNDLWDNSVLKIKDRNQGLQK